MRDLRIVFMGTPYFAVGVLKELVENNYCIVGVITAPDKPAGRGRKLSQSAIKQYALKENLPILQPKNLKDPLFIEELESLKANLQIVVAFRMLPKVVWQLPKYGTFNLHASLLPEYRGAAPINWAIINGEKKTGVTTFFIDEKIDTGAIIDSSEVFIDENETAGTLHDKLMITGAELVIQTVNLIAEDKAHPKPQSKDLKYKEAPKLHSENTKIDWNQDVKKVDQLIRGLSPYPAAWSYLSNQDEEIKVKIYHAKVVEKEFSLSLGSIHIDNKQIYVVTKNGTLMIEELQLPGKRKMNTRDLLNGYHFEKTAKFF